MDFPNFFFFIFLVKNSRFANMKKLFHFMHLEIWTKVPIIQSQVQLVTVKMERSRHVIPFDHSKSRGAGPE